MNRTNALSIVALLLISVCVYASSINTSKSKDVVVNKKYSDLPSSNMYTVPMMVYPAIPVSFVGAYR